MYTATSSKCVLISGGSGLLGSELQKVDATIIAPSHESFDITDINKTEGVFKQYRPDIYIHCAAIVGTDECNANPVEALDVNIGGVLNTVKMSIKYPSRYIYISTEYVFETNKTKKGNFIEEDPIGAVNFYARTKIAGEMAVTANSNHLVIRTSFIGRDYIKYKGAFNDQYTTRDYVDIIAPHILEAAKSSMIGVLHIGTEKKTQYDLLRIAFPKIKPIQRADINPSLSSDTSLNCDKWKKFMEQITK